MSTAASPTTAAPQVLVPYLAVAGAADALDWYRDALGAIETTRFVGDDGRIGHAEIVVGGARIMLADEYPEMDVIGPVARGGTSVTLHLQVVDVDHTFRLATDAGARAEREPSDQGHGSRQGTFVDPFGHRWMVSQPLDAERAAAAEEATGTGGDGGDWTVTGRQPNEPGYLVLHVPDLDRARRFYGELFAWQVGGGSIPGGGHVENTRFPLGFAPPPDDGDRPVTAYFRVDDLDPFVRRVTELGGQVLQVHEWASGGGAECIDDQGVRFDLFRPAPGY